MEKRQQAGRPFILGITGGVGAGKSTVMAYLKEKYAAVCILCDEVARALQKKGGAGYGPMLSLLAQQKEASFWLREDSEFDREKIAEAVFADPVLLKKLNALIHPLVNEEVQKQIAAAGESHCALVALESAILRQAGYEAICDEIWCVTAPVKEREQRLKTSRGYSAERIKKMFVSQGNGICPGDTNVLENKDGDWETTAKEIDRRLSHYGILQHSEREQR